MEFMTGKKEKEVLDLAAVFADGMEGREVKVNGAIMSVRNMGDIAFVILRKRDGVLQTVYEKGVTDADFAELREETFVEVSRCPPKRRAGAERHGTSFKECSDPLETGRTDADCRIKMENERIPGSQTGYAFSDTPQPAGARTFQNPGRNRTGIPGVPAWRRIYGNSFPEDRSKRSRGRSKRL